MMPGNKEEDGMLAKNGARAICVGDEDDGDGDDGGGDGGGEDEDDDDNEDEELKDGMHVRFTRGGPVEALTSDKTSNIAK